MSPFAVIVLLFVAAYVFYKTWYTNGRGLEAGAQIGSKYLSEQPNAAVWGN